MGQAEEYSVVENRNQRRRLRLVWMSLGESIGATYVIGIHAFMMVSPEHPHDVSHLVGVAMLDTSTKTSSLLLQNSKLKPKVKFCEVKARANGQQGGDRSRFPPFLSRFLRGQEQLQHSLPSLQT